jgi:chorismate synthase
VLTEHAQALQQSSAKPDPPPGRSSTTTPPAYDERDSRGPTARPARWTAPRVSAGRMTCAAFVAPAG